MTGTTTTVTRLEIYKPGQGRYARWIAYILGTLMIIWGGQRLYATINEPFVADQASPLEKLFYIPDLPLIGHLSVYRIIALVAVLLGILGLHLVLNRPTAVDTLIDTEQELKKVSWPSRREVQNATIVVILVTFSMAMILYGFDGLLRWLFRLVY